MLDPSILVGPNSHTVAHGQVSPALPNAPDFVQLAAQAESRAQTLAAMVEMLSDLDSCRDLDDAAQRTSRKLCELLPASRIVVLWRNRPTSGLSIIADSSSDGGKGPHDVESRMLIAAGEEIAARNELTQWSEEGTGQQHALMAVAQLAKSLSLTSLIGIGLFDAAGHDRGVVMAIAPTDAASRQFLDAVGPSLASKLVGVHSLQPSAFENAIRSCVDLAQGKKRKLILSILACLGLAMLFPAHYKIDAELELQPVQHRFVAVPFDGPLESSDVRPGDIVSKGDLLAMINPREVEYELAGIRAELNRALQERRD